MNKVYNYYNSKEIIDNMLDPEYFGKNLWHTPLLFKSQNENDFLIENSGIKNGDNILDFGCGLGGFLDIVTNKYKCNAIGVNISPKQLEIARKNLSNKKIEFIYFWNMISLPNNSIDIVFAQESIVHYDDKKELFNYFYNMLKPKGILIFQDWFLYNKELAVKTDEIYKTFLKPLDLYKDLINKIGFKKYRVYQPENTDIINNNKKELGFTNYIIKCEK
jgi:ubiquinone/menaquinone biosynthesis C-methylase UbiE